MVKIETIYRILAEKELPETEITPVDKPLLESSIVKTEKYTAIISSDTADNESKAKAHIERGKIKLELLLFSEARDDFGNAIKLKPVEPVRALAYYLRGLAVLQRYGHGMEALDNMGTAIELNPTAEVYHTMGGIRQNFGDFDSLLIAKDYYEQALKLEFILENRPILKEKIKDISGKLQDHIKEATRFIENHPERETEEPLTVTDWVLKNYVNRGRAELAIGLFEKALADFNKAIEFTPDDRRWYYLRALTYEHLGHMGLAKKD